MLVWGNILTRPKTLPYEAAIIFDNTLIKIKTVYPAADTSYPDDQINKFITVYITKDKWGSSISIRRKQTRIRYQAESAGTVI